MGRKSPEQLVSETGKNIPPSAIREFFDIVYDMPDCVSLGVGEPDFTTPWRISDTGIYSIKDGHTHYTSNKGLSQLRKLLVNDIEKRFKVKYDEENEIILTMGVSQGLDLALRSIVNPGDEVIIVEPCYVSYNSNVVLLHGVPVVVSTYSDENFRISPEKLKKAVTSKTKAIILNYPSNPTGSSLSKENLKQIAEFAIEHNIIVISDEIYSSIVYEKEHFSIIEIPGMRERTIYLNGFSKSHAMTGWRLGYIVAPEFLTSIMLKIHQYTALSAPTAAQYAAIEAMEKGEKDVNLMVKEYTKRRNYIVSRFNEIGFKCLYPLGAFYAFPDISASGLNSRKFALGLLKAKKVAVVPGNAFGVSGEKHIRCSFATSMENIKTALDRIEEFKKEL
jgi:aminotransferase